MKPVREEVYKSPAIGKGNQEARENSPQSADYPTTGISKLSWKEVERMATSPPMAKTMMTLRSRATKRKKVPKFRILVL